jgi:hypothetical protein
VLEEGPNPSKIQNELALFFFPEEDRFSHWAFIPFGNDLSNRGANWENLYCMILDQWRGRRLAVPSMATYFRGAQEWEEGVIIAVE